MAGKELSDIYCWEIESDKLKIYLASTKKGALRVGISLKKAPDCVTYFRNIYPFKNIVRDAYRNGPLAESVKAALSNRPERHKFPLDIHGSEPPPSCFRLTPSGGCRGSRRIFKRIGSQKISTQ